MAMISIICNQNRFYIIRYGKDDSRPTLLEKINEIDGHNLSFVFSIGRFLITANAKKAAGATKDITVITEN